MTYFEAVKVLALAKDGKPVPSEVIAEALFLSGDGPCPDSVPDPDIEEFVQALREEGLI